MMIEAMPTPASIDETLIPKSCMIIKTAMMTMAATTMLRSIRKYVLRFLLEKTLSVFFMPMLSIISYNITLH